MRNYSCALITLVLLCSPFAAAETRHITQDELVRRTQELVDALAPGDQGPWKKYYAEDCLFFDEKGRSFDKAAMVKDIAPLPKGYSGTINVVRPQSRIVANTAIFSYDMDESEVVYGQKLSARYHATDTWLYRDGTWQIIATQVHRYYEDPAVGTIDPTSLNLYVGTYELAPGVTMRVTRDGDKLYTQRAGRDREELFPETTGIFFRKGVEGRRLFHVANDGTVDLLIERRNNEDIIWKRVQHPAVE